MSAARPSIQLCLSFLAALAFPFLLAGQTCSITSPAASQFIQAAQPIQLTATVASAPTAYKLVWFVDYQRWAQGFNADQRQAPVEFNEAWTGTPFAVTWYTGLDGDGPHTVSGILYDIFGNQLATCPAVSFTVRIQGFSNVSFNPPMPTSGTGPFGVNLPTTGLTVHSMLDGMDISGNSYYTIPSYYYACGGNNQAMMVTSCWPNGQHLVMGGLDPNTGASVDPFVKSQAFASSSVSGNVINVANHVFQNTRPVVFSTTGTLPSPIVAGCQYLWATSSSNPSNTATLAIASGVITITLSSSCATLTTGSPVYLQNIPSTNLNTGQPNCDGYYSAASVSGNTFTVSAPSGCPNGISVSNCSSVAGNCALEVDINPYFVQYDDANDISVSAKPGGSTVALTCSGCSGTILTRLNSPYWTGSGQNGFPGGSFTMIDYVLTGPPANIYQLVTFNNGTSPMQIQVPYWEYHGYAGKAGDTACPTGILNTDLSLTSKSCGSFTYALTQDGGITGAISVNTSTGAITYNTTSSWSNPSAQSAWAKVTVSCPTCNATGNALPTVTVYIENHGNSASSVTFPHFTHSGPIATSFTPGSSFYPISVWQAGSQAQMPWAGPAFQRANVNSIWYGLSYPTNLMNPAATSCPAWSTDQTMTGVANFLTTYNMNLELDMYNIWFNAASNPMSLAAILNNTGYNRHACLQSYISYWQSTGHVWHLGSEDEVTNILGLYLNPNPSIGGNRFISMTTSGGVATFNISNLNSGVAVWNQSAGTGNAIQILGLTTNSACNGWYLLSSISNTTFTAPTPPGCANGLTITSSTDPGGQISMPFPALSAGGGNFPLQNAGPLPSNLNASPPEQSLSSSIYITTSGSTATLTWPNHGLATGQAIRIWSGSTANLNIIAPVTVVNSSTVTFTYPGTTGGAAPSCQPCNNSTDPSAYITVDPNWGPNPLSQFYSIINSMPNPPATLWTILGGFFDGPNQTLIDFQGTPSNSSGAFIYVQLPPNNYTGPDATVWQWMNYANPWGALNSRAYQLRPRVSLITGGYIGNNATIQLCRSFAFNPACDRPAALYWRPETKVAQIMGLKTMDVVGNRLYDEYDHTDFGYSFLCCGWQNQGNWAGIAMNPFVGQKMWNAYAHINALLKMREDTELQPETNKPYLGPYFQTDAHLSATYGNETTVLCGDEMPYGQITVPLNPISGGSTIVYTTDGYTTTVSNVSGNPSSVKQEFCTSPGKTWVYVSQPPGYTALDNITFGPPELNGVVSLPFGASKFLIQVGYYPDDMRSDPVTDCTSSCTIPIDHHNVNAWYRVIDANSNSLPVSIGAPVEIPSQGLY